MTRNGRPRVAILGAGPVGLEAALAAREAKLPFRLYEAGPEVGEHVRRWGHVELFTPWELDVSPRMRRALESSGREVPEGTGCPDGEELVDRLLLPLAALPGMDEALATGTRVVGVGRRGMVKSDAIGAPERGRPPFRILLSDGSGREWTEEAEIVLDCTGTYGHPNRLGDGGIPAPGERVLEDRIVRTIPDVVGAPDEWAGSRVLLVGSGHSAQTAARDLARLAREAPDTRVVWAVRSETPDWGAVPEDPLPRRKELTARSRELAAGASPAVTVRTGVVVDSLTRAEGGTRVRLRPRFGDGQASEVAVDRIVGLTGSVGDHALYRQLQVHECYATSGPMNLSAALLGAGSADCMDQTTHGSDTLVNPEPGFFLLGAKSYGRNNTFLIRVGWGQVDEVFDLVAARA